MKSLIISITVLCSFFIIQVVEAEAALAPNEIKIQESSVKHGPKFGEGWSGEQKKIWNKTQEWWQLRMVGNWVDLEKTYHQDAILYHYFHKVPFEFPVYKEMMTGKIFKVVYCTVHEIRIIENVAVVMIYYEISFPIPPKRMIFVWKKQGTDWELIATMTKEE